MTQSLHPSIPALQPGSTEVWYSRSTRDLGMGYDYCWTHDLLPDPANLTKTHTLLAKVAGKDPEHLFEMLQGENWGRGEETNAILREKGLHRTSMCVGDILVIDGQVLMCDRAGFVELTKAGAAC